MLKNGLYFVATPIGNLKDITLRALDTLKTVAEIYCEDTRVSKKLLNHYGIQTPVKVFHDHSPKEVIDRIIEFAEKAPIAIISDAGTPLISDPGHCLRRAAIDGGIYTTSIPGACAAITALTLSNAPSHQFMFAGFFDEKKFEGLKDVPATLIFYESPRRMEKTLNFLNKKAGKRMLSIGRELTKQFEQNIYGCAGEVLEILQQNNQLRGEFVICISPETIMTFTEDDILAALKLELEHDSPKDAIKNVSIDLNMPKKQVYRLYLDHFSDRNNSKIS